MKKDFTPAELELVLFKNGSDVIATSTQHQSIGPVGGDDMTEED